jgi:hypothetical protein
MKREKAKQKALAAVRAIVQAAKELSEAEAAYRKIRAKQKGRKNE